MATPVFCCGFECGVLGTNAGQHWNTGGLSGSTISTTTVRSGLRSLRANPTAQASGAGIVLSTAAGKFVTRFYIRFATLPTANALLQYITASPFFGVCFKQSDSKIYGGSVASGVFSFGATGVAVTTGVWYRIDSYLDRSTTTYSADVQVDGVACTQYTVAGTAGNTTGLALGDGINSKTYDIFFDDVIVSNTQADYPIGEGKVMGYVPNGDGTHTSTGTTTVKGTIAAPTAGGAITNATTDAFNWVNARPILGGATDNTRLINAQTNAATTYVEVAFEDSVEVNAPRAVEVLSADRQAATTTGDMSVKINDNGTESVVIARSGTAGTTTDKYATKQFATAPTGGAWNLNASGNASFQNIKVRFGYSGDATPDQYWRGIMIEAEFAITVVNASMGATAGSYALSGVSNALTYAQPFIAQKPIIFSQAINRSSNF